MKKTKKKTMSKSMGKSMKASSNYGTIKESMGNNNKKKYKATKSGK